MANIIICCNSFPPEKGGAPNRVYNLAALLCANGYKVTVITAMPNYPKGQIFPEYRGRLVHKEMVAGIEVIRLWLWPSNSASLVLRGLSLISQLISFTLLGARKLMKSPAKTVIISSPPLVSAWLAAIFAKLAGKKILMNISDIWPLTASEMGALNKGPVFKILQLTERHLYKMATAFTGQSQEILDHIQEYAPGRQPALLYRNLQEEEYAPAVIQKSNPERIQLIYAGNLGHAQGMLELCSHVDFEAAGADLHIYGEGAERQAIAEGIGSGTLPAVFLHPTVPSAVLTTLLGRFDLMLIPLKTAIRGAVPSKLFLAVAHQLPVLFCGGGEGALLVNTHQLGWISPPGDYAALQQQLNALRTITDDEWKRIREKIAVSRTGCFSKPIQDKAFMDFIAQL